MKKQIRSLLLALVMVLSLFPATATANELDNGLQYEAYGDHVEITGYVGDASEVVIPSEIEGLPVTTICDYAFMSCYTLTSIDIPDSVFSLGNHTFAGCSNLEHITIPTYVTTLGEYTLSGCVSLTSVFIPANVSSISWTAFGNCSSLTEFQVSENNRYYCSDDRGVLYTKDMGELLKAPGGITGSYEIPDSVFFIHPYAFEYCSKLTSVTIPDSVTYLFEYVFSYCSSLTSIDLPDSITDISYSAFEGCSSLTSIDLPDGLTSINDSLFEDCTSLTSITLPDSVTSIHTDAFLGCSSLTGIYVSENHPKYATGDLGVLLNKDKTHLLLAPAGMTGSYMVPDSVTTIGPSAFMNCAGLVSVTIPDSVTSIGFSAFENCTGLVSVSIPNGVTSIKSSMFFGCSNLTDVYIPDSVTLIDYHAFRNCYNLSSITIPDSVITIRNFSFMSCKNLTSVIFHGDVPQIGADAFRYTSTTAYYPANNATWTEDVMQNYGGNITWVSYASNPFTDVPAGSYYEEAVLWALENGITTGASETSFNPNGECLRAHVVTFLHRAEKSPEPTSSSTAFTDVKPTDFFYKPVLWAVEQGITNGLSSTQFGSYGVCNRAQVVTFLWRTAGSPTVTADNPFADVKSTDYYYNAVLWAVENGITNGIDVSQFGPNEPCNRAQVVTFLYRAYN